MTDNDDDERLNTFIAIDRNNTSTNYFRASIRDVPGAERAVVPQTPRQIDRLHRILPRNEPTMSVDRHTIYNKKDRVDGDKSKSIQTTYDGDAGAQKLAHKVLGEPRRIGVRRDQPVQLRHALKSSSVFKYGKYEK